MQSTQQSTQPEDINQYLPKRECQTVSFKSLSKRTLDVVVEHFNKLCTKTTSEKQISPSPQTLDQILKVLPIDKLEHAVGAEFVDCESFYKRVSVEKYGNGKCILESHGLSWKRLYFEKLLCNLLAVEEDDHHHVIEEETLEIVSHFVFVFF
jgi:hypothetical protein